MNFVEKIIVISTLKNPKTNKKGGATSDGIQLTLGEGEEKLT